MMMHERFQRNRLSREGSRWHRFRECPDIGNVK
jgi:hypothetical protein